MRRDYNKQLMTILFVTIASFGVTFGAYRLTRGENEKINNNDPIYSDPTVMQIPPKEEIVEILEEKIEPSQPSGATFIFIEPKVVDDDLENDSQIQIPDGEKNAGFTNGDGDPDALGGDGDGPDFSILDETPTLEDNTPKLYVDEYAEFPGGITARTNFLQTKIIYPEDAAREGVTGTCYLRFVVSKDGEISFVEVTKGIKDCPECNKEAIRVVKSMPKWKPGKVNGNPVNSYFDLKVSFQTE
ncbi:MAG: energy transducer TonB [Flavobacteriia bacterium]|nr:energy transducer TonB [Flavobacteriia bacterium]